MDLSVIGGPLDDAFAAPSRAFVAAIMAEKAIALISDTLIAEIDQAPQAVREVLANILNGPHERLPITEAAIELQEAYLRASVVPDRFRDDALHVAQATLARADVIVSWNFKHLVNPARIRQFNDVNLALGYEVAIILTPADVVETLEPGDE